VAVIGGGVGGLTAALALRQRGIDVSVYEQAPELTEIGAGLNLGPNAMKAFRTLGLEADIAAIGHEADYQVVRDWRSSRVISRVPRKGYLTQRFGASHYTVHRADLQGVMSRGLPKGDIQLGARCVGVDADATSACARFSDGTSIEADVVVGADGIHSVVRESLFGPEAPHFTGLSCWRGLVPLDALPAGLIGTDGNTWMGPHGHVVHYLVRRGQLVNFVAHYKTDAWTEESWTRQCDQSELLATYRGWHDTLLRLFESSDRYYRWALYDRDPLGSWSKGRATLLGDSAHAMLPYLGQGACMAIEDGCILAAALSGMPQDLSGALKLYEQVRLPRARGAVLGSRARAEVNHLSSPWKRLSRDVRLALSQRFGRDKMVMQPSWLYDYDIAAESQRLASGFERDQTSEIRHQTVSDF
jgi:salicylate hydroxylase